MFRGRSRPSFRNDLSRKHLRFWTPSGSGLSAVNVISYPVKPACNRSAGATAALPAVDDGRKLMRRVRAIRAVRRASLAALARSAHQSLLSRLQPLHGTRGRGETGGSSGGRARKGARRLRVRGFALLHPFVTVSANDPGGRFDRVCCELVQSGFAVRYVELWSDQQTRRKDTVGYLLARLLSAGLAGVGRDKSDPLHHPGPFLVVITGAARLAEMRLLRTIQNNLSTPALHEPAMPRLNRFNAARFRSSA